MWQRKRRRLVLLLINPEYQYMALFVHQLAEGGGGYVRWDGLYTLMWDLSPSLLCVYSVYKAKEYFW
jgi:hypothetical protein